MTFTPNWYGKFDDVQHALEGMLKALEINRKAILKHSGGNEAVFVLGDKIFTLKEKGYAKGGERILKS